jgi:hypothetical protein
MHCLSLSPVPVHRRHFKCTALISAHCLLTACSLHLGCPVPLPIHCSLPCSLPCLLLFTACSLHCVITRQWIGSACGEGNAIEVVKKMVLVETKARRCVKGNRELTDTVGHEAMKGQEGVMTLLTLGNATRGEERGHQGIWPYVFVWF